MTKKTDSWVLRYSLSNQTLPQKQVQSISYNFSKGHYEHLLTTGEVITREPKENESRMPLFLFEEFFKEEKGKDGITRKNRYLQRTFDCPKPSSKKTDFSEEEWNVLQKNKCIIDFLKRHNEISHKDINGKQLNKNLPDGTKSYYELINTDDQSNQEAESEIRYNELINEVVGIMDNEDDFRALAWGVGMNPTGLSNSAIFNLMKNVVRNDMTGFDNFLHRDSDRYLKTVINQALRTAKTDDANDESFITQDEHKNYRMNGVLLAGSYDSLLIYFKENSEMFEGLEIRMGLKKKQNLADSVQEPAREKEQEPEPEVAEISQNLQTREVAVTHKSPGRPRKQS